MTNLPIRSSLRLESQVGFGRCKAAFLRRVSIRYLQERSHEKAHSCIYKYPAINEDAKLTVRLRHPQFPGRLVEQGDDVSAQKFLGPVLCLLPGRDRPLQKPLPLGGEAERLSPGVLTGHDFQPTLGPHALDVAAERG